MLEKLLAINLAVLILIQAWVVKVYVRTWIFPACLYGLFWFVYTFIPLVALPDTEVSPASIAYILATCVLFSLSSMAFNWKLAFEKNKNRKFKLVYSSIFLKFVFYFFGVVSVAATVINWGIQEISYYDILFNLLDTSNQYLGKRYSGELSANLAAQLSITLTYPTAILGGMLFYSKDHRDGGVRYILLSVASSLLMLVVEAAKGTIFLTLILFWSGILIAKINDNNLKLFNIKYVYKIFPWIILVAAATVFSFLARGVSTDEHIGLVVDKIYYYFISYSSGHLYAFSDWFTSVVLGQSKLSYQSIENSDGFYTFMAVFNLFGTDKVAPPGVYDEYFQIPEVLQTNIYTHFRGLIHDFGFAGSLVVFLVAGLIANIAYFLQLTGRRPSLSVSFFSHLLGYIYTSFIISLLIWNSVYASFFILSLVLFVNNWLQSDQLKSRPNNSTRILINEHTRNL